MRIDGWEGRLCEYIAASKDLPFTWGRHDCALWAARWVEECTGEDFYSNWIGQYVDEASANALVRTRGFNSYADIADAILEVKPVMLAQRGDIVLHPTGALGISNGRLCHFLGQDHSFTENTLSCKRAWKVG